MSEMPNHAYIPCAGYGIALNDRVYQLGNELGEGYFGKVFACRDRWSNDLVAKVLIPRGRTYEDVRQQWTGELENLVRLRHPNITYVYDAFEHRNTFYLIIERCGTDLHQLLQIPDYNGELWLPALARDVLQGLEFIHSAGYVHKDLHLGNVFAAWTRDRMVPTKNPVASFKIGDLGISRLESDINVFNTMLAQWMMPPEAIDPLQFGLVGRGVDIYHVGLVFLAVILGEVPEFSREDIVCGEPRKLAESLNSVYGQPVALALRRHVAQRPRTAADLWEALVSVMPDHAKPF